MSRFVSSFCNVHLKPLIEYFCSAAWRQELNWTLFCSCLGVVPVVPLVQIAYSPACTTFRVFRRIRNGKLRHAVRANRLRAAPLGLLEQQTRTFLRRWFVLLLSIAIGGRPTFWGKFPATLPIRIPRLSHQTLRKSVSQCDYQRDI